MLCSFFHHPGLGFPPPATESRSTAATLEARFTSEMLCRTVVGVVLRLLTSRSRFCDALRTAGTQLCATPPAG